MANWMFQDLKTTSDGETFGSDKALKYLIKKCGIMKGKRFYILNLLKLSEAGKKGEIFNFQNH